MRSRVLAIVIAVVVPLAALGVVIARGGGTTHKPSRLPIAVSGGIRENATFGAPAADAALYPYGAIVYKADPNLPALDGSAHAYRVTGGADADSLHRLTAAFGLHGEATGNSKDGFTLQDGDAQFSAYPSAGGSWNYARESFGGGVSSSSGVAVACPPDTSDCAAPETTIPQHPADLPSQEEARRIALELLQRAGIDTDNAAVTVDDFTTQWSVRVDPIVDGVPTEGFSTTVTIGEKGVVEYAYGVLGRPERADEYPLIGTSAAIGKLNNGEIYYGGGPRPMMAEDTAVATASGGGGVAGSAPPSVGSTGAEPAAPTEPFPVPPCDGVGAPTTFPCNGVPPDTFVPPPPQEITLVDAERVLMFAVSYDGNESFLVPAYRFTTSDGFGPTVLAIDDSFLAPPPGARDDKPVEPQPAPGPPGTIEPQPVPEAKPGG